MKNQNQDKPIYNQLFFQLILACIIVSVFLLFSINLFDPLSNLLIRVIAIAVSVGVLLFSYLFIRKTILRHIKFSTVSVLISLIVIHMISFSGFQGKHIFIVFIGIVLYILLRKCINHAVSLKISIISLILSSIFSFFLFFGLQLETYGTLHFLHSTFRTSVVWILYFFELQLSIYIFFCPFFGYCLNCIPLLGDDITFHKHFQSYIIILFILWIPYYLAFFPGITTTDSANEISSVLGLSPLSNHHPVIHQFLIFLSFKIRGFLHCDYNIGVAIYSCIQSFSLIFIIAFSLDRICIQYHVPAKYCILLCIFYAVFTINPLYSLTMWKDVLFGGFTLLLFTLLINSNTIEKRSIALLVLVSFLFCTFRNNGYYAFIFSFILIILFNKSSRKILVLIFVPTILLISIYQYSLFTIHNVSKSETGELLSVPLQQIARVMSQCDGEISSTDKEDFSTLAELFENIDNLKDLYNPRLADPVKQEGFFRSDIFNSEPQKYIRCWFRIGLRHPVTYLEAFLEQNYGYWYPNTSYWCASTEMDEIEGFNFKQNTIFEKLRYMLVALHQELSGNSLLSVLYSAATPLWVIMISVCNMILKGMKKPIFASFIFLGIWLTTLFSPVYCEYRYIYGLSLSAPMLFVVSTFGKESVHEIGS